jgi:hypothetical protein
MRRALSIFASLVLLGASSVQAGNVRLVIRHRYGGQPLQLNTPVVNAAGEQMTIGRCAYLLSAPSLKSRSDGQWLRSRNWFAYVNAAQSENVQVLDNLPAEKFNALRFYVGVDEATDKTEPGKYPARHPLNPVVNGLHWGWAGGFVYLALEGHLLGTGEGFSYHLAGAENRMEVTLPVELDLSRDNTVEIAFHLEHGRRPHSQSKMFMKLPPPPRPRRPGIPHQAARPIR